MVEKAAMGLVVAVMGAALLAGCTGEQGAGGRPPAPLPGEALPAPEGGLHQPVWLQDGWIYFLPLTTDFDPDGLWRTKAGAKAEKVNLPEAPGCRRTRWNSLHRLPDGRLGLVRECLTEDARNDTFEVVAFTPATAKVESLVALGNMNVGRVEWAPDLKSGYVSYSTSICASIAPLTLKGPAHFSGPVTIDGKSWALDHGVFKPAGESCTDDGRVDQPVLLPDGKTLILAASPTSQGFSGDSRLDRPWNIYRWQPGAGNPRQLAQGFGDPLGLEITPDGKWAVLATKNGGKEGVWGIDVESGKTVKLADGKPKGVSISLDGKRAVVEFSPDTGDLEYNMVHEQLRVIDLAPLM